MKELQSEIGRRLQEIRFVFNNGFKAGTEQFASELGESRYNISNYEAGKANIPPRLLIALYEHGFNPLYILTGEGSKYAENEEGKKRSKASAAFEKSDIRFLGHSELKLKSVEELSEIASEHLAAASDIMKFIQSKKKEEIDKQIS